MKKFCKILWNSRLPALVDMVWMDYNNSVFSAGAKRICGFPFVLVKKGEFDEQDQKRQEGVCTPER